MTKLFPPGILKDSNNPLKILSGWELQSKTIAKKALKAGLQDLISQINEFPVDLRISMDKDLLANKLPSLVELQGITVKTIARVLKRQYIKTLEEFYIVKEEVINLDSNLTEEDRLLLDILLAEFELNKGNKKGI